MVGHAQALSTARKSKPPLVPKGNAIPSNTNTGQTSTINIGPNPFGVGSASGGGASNRHGDIVVPKDGSRSKGDDNDRSSITFGSIFRYGRKNTD